MKLHSSHGMWFHSYCGPEDEELSGALNCAADVQLLVCVNYCNVHLMIKEGEAGEIWYCLIVWNQGRGNKNSLQSPQRDDRKMWCLPVVTGPAPRVLEDDVSSWLNSKTVWSRKHWELRCFSACAHTMEALGDPLWLTDRTLVWEYKMATDTCLELDFEEL